MKALLIILLIISGYISLFSQSKCIIPCRADILNLSERIAIDEVGIVELSGRNDGPVIKYLEAVGIYAPAPYCAAGQYYCFSEASKMLGLNSSSIPIIKSGSCSAIRMAAKKTGIRAKFRPARHDLIFWASRQPPDGHVERIIFVGRAGSIKTIGFNTSGIINGKKTEGVFIKKRNILHPLARMAVVQLIGFREI